MLARLEPERMALLQAADEIERRGWTQGQTIDRETGRVCAIGAISLVVNGAVDPCNRYAREQMQPVVRLFMAAVPCRSIYDWNDEPGRTQAEVVAKLREVAVS